MRCVPAAGSDVLQSSAITLCLDAFAERLPHGVVVGHWVERDEFADRLVSHDDLVHRVDERSAGRCVDVADQGQP
jgi:hypothetical protein